LQIITTAVLAFAHGANDTQKAMGILVLTLNAGGYMTGNDIPLWVRVLYRTAMAVGIASLAPGIVKRVGLEFIACDHCTDSSPSFHRQQ